VGNSYYKGVATINVSDNGEVSLNVPSEAVFSQGFAWVWKVSPNVVSFQYESADSAENLGSSSKVDILSNGDTKFVIV